MGRNIIGNRQLRNEITDESHIVNIIPSDTAATTTIPKPVSTTAVQDITILFSADGSMRTDMLQRDRDCLAAICMLIAEITRLIILIQTVNFLWLLSGSSIGRRVVCARGKSSK